MECYKECYNGLRSQFLHSIASLNLSEKKHLVNSISEITVNKSEILVEAGKVSDKLFYVESGLLRTFHIDDNGSESTSNFAIEGDFFGVYESFYGNITSTESIQAVFNSKVKIIHKSAIEALYEKGEVWQVLGRRFVEFMFIDSQWRLSTFQRLDAKQRYQLIIEACPLYAQRIPQQYLATYLGITPRHLTRLRSEIRF
ncbi:cAMP-binding protein [Fulvitalea axinellae]|uniref:cAMP-binding protein n=1 Tax=Fulvitalea axinellae TaxID=1182444 RepID=A0AAU9D9A9_9BACT|nr:cAMP-binding protein [Fulvitalea axinellae]